MPFLDVLGVFLGALHLLNSPFRVMPHQVLQILFETMHMHRVVPSTHRLLRTSMRNLSFLYLLELGVPMATPGRLRLRLGIGGLSNLLVVGFVMSPRPFSNRFR